MNKKFLSILTGVSALAVAGLLSIIPASVSHAAPSQAPATVTERTTVSVFDWRDTDDDAPRSTDSISEDCEFEYTYSGDAVIHEFYHLGLVFYIYSDTRQEFSCEGLVNAVDTDDDNNDYRPFSENDTIGGTFRFTYDETDYAVTGYTSLLPGVYSSGYNASFTIANSGNFVATATSPSTTPSGTPAAPSENHGTPSDDPAAKAFNEAIDNTVNEIELAILGLNADGTVNETRTVEYKSSGAISPKIISALAHAENVTLIYTFEYEGIIFQSAITSEAAAAMYSPTIPWYGPCYIATFCPPIPIGFVQ